MLWLLDETIHTNFLLLGFVHNNSWILFYIFVLTFIFSGLNFKFVFIQMIDIIVVVIQSLICVQLFATLCNAMDRSTPSCPSPSPGVCSNSCPLNWWCHPTISTSIVPFSSCLQSLPATGSFPMSQFLEKRTDLWFKIV